MFFKVCRNEKSLIEAMTKNQQNLCRYLHHNDFYLKLGPFKEETYSSIPYTVVFHDILSEEEMSYLIQESITHLTDRRSFSRTFDDTSVKSGQRRRIVKKQVQHWIQEVEFKPISKQTAGNER